MSQAPTSNGYPDARRATSDHDVTDRGRAYTEYRKDDCPHCGHRGWCC